MGTAYVKTWYKYNDTAANNSRDLEFWKVEGQQALNDKWFSAVRYSGMNANNGYPVAGMGARGPYFFGPFLTEELRRLSMGLSYWPNQDVVLKVDYIPTRTKFLRK